MNTILNSTARRDIDSYIHPYTNLKSHLDAGPLVITRGEGVRVFELVGDAQQVDPATGKRLDHFAAGLAHYRDRRWKEAADAFAAAAAMGDAPAQVFAERCQHYRADPPPPDWDGTYVMQTK